MRQGLFAGAALRSLRIARHETRLLFRSGALAALSAALTLLVVAAAITGKARHEERSLQVARFRHIIDEQWKAQPDRHPHRVAHYGFLVFREQPFLGFADPGVFAHAGQALFLEAHRQNFATFAEGALATGASRLGELTLASVFHLLLPLALLIASSLTVARDRNDGTEALALSQGASLADIVMGKWLGLLMGLAIAFAPAFLILLLALAGAENQQPVRLGLFAIVSALHLAVTAALGTALSAFSKSTRGALIAALGFWVLTFVVAPRAVTAAASALWPLPSRAEFDARVERQMRELGDSHDPNDPKFGAFKRALLEQQGVATVADLKENYNGLQSEEGEKHSSVAYDQHVSEVRTTLDRHDLAAKLGGFLSPYLATRGFASAIAGSDERHIREFDRQAEVYRYDLIQRLNRLHAEKVEYAKDRYSGGTEGATPTRQRIDRGFFEALPAFEFVPPTLAWSLRERSLSIVSVLAWCALGIGALVSAARDRGRSERA